MEMRDDLQSYETPLRPFAQCKLYRIVAPLAYLPLLWDNPVWRILLQRCQSKTR